MNPDAANLDNLRDIVEPPPAGWWPLAPGWWIVLGLVALAGLVWGIRAWRKWRANRYRREALQELGEATSITQVSAILKRTALAAYARTEVASLSGRAWPNWLGQTAGEALPDPVARALAEGPFANTETSQIAEAIDYATLWIKNHRVST